jgi:phosphoadenosine phosphosulfate reductase
VAADPGPAEAARELLRSMLRAFPGRIAAVSSFGAESAVLLHLLANIDPAVPVIFLDTGKLFAETLEYRDTLVRRLRLVNVRSARPDAGALAEQDRQGTLWREAPDQCCWHRKVEPLDAALAGFAAWITGRKRAHGGGREMLDSVETGTDGRIKVNPLAEWSAEEVAAYFDVRGLPRHPLAGRGYRSVGCVPCTRASAPGEAPRAGRWAGSGKTECGIHTRLPPSEPSGSRLI